MNIAVLIASLSLNCFASKNRQMNPPLAPAATIALNGYSPLSLPFPKTLKECLTLLRELPPAVHALPRVVTPAKYSSAGWEV